MRSLLSLLTLLLIPLLLIAFIAPELSAQSEQELIYAVESLSHTDGTFSYRRLIYDRQTGQFSPVEVHDASPVARQAEELPPNFMFQPLLVQQSSRWAWPAAKTFNVAEDAPTNARVLMTNKPLVRAMMNLVHVRRGSLRIPKYVLGNQTIAVQEIADPVREVQQFNFDNRNVIARTADNRLFQLDPPGVSSRAIRFESGNCALDGGVYRCQLFLRECDIYVKARTMEDAGFFEDFPVARQRRDLAGHYKFCQGHNFNTWGHDLSGQRNREVVRKTFDRNNSLVWNGERAEDKLLYGDPGVAATAPQPQAPTLHPPTDSVIDLGFVKPPVIDLTRSERENLFGYKAIALTNLKGFSRGKDLRLQVFRGDSTRLQDRILGPLRGASIDRVGGRSAVCPRSSNIV